MEEPGNSSAFGSNLPLATVWPAYSRELHAWLQRNAPSFADPYQGAVRLVGMPHFPGRIHLIAHVVRDLYNRLPQMLCGIKHNRPSYEPEIRAIARIWPLTASGYREGADTLKPNESLLVSRPAALAVAQLVHKYQNRHEQWDVVKSMYRTKAEARQSDWPILEPTAKDFQATANWFMARTHIPDQVTHAPGHKELLRRFEQFTVLALSLTRGFFTTMGELDELLQQANTTAG